MGQIGERGGILVVAEVFLKKGLHKSERMWYNMLELPIKNHFLL